MLADNNQADEILKLIEKAKPEHHGMLTDIDTLVWSYITGKNAISSIYDSVHGELSIASTGADGDPAVVFYYPRIYKTKSYTRSRDALKSVRPNNLLDFSVHKRRDNLWDCMWSTDKEELRPEKWAVRLPTEELAELHAIIQAIKWERAKKLTDKTEV